MFGFLAFNGGSAGDILTPGNGQVVALAMFNTLLCAAFAGLVCLIYHKLTVKKFVILPMINAVLTGKYHFRTKSWQILIP